MFDEKEEVSVSVPSAAGLSGFDISTTASVPPVEFAMYAYRPETTISEALEISPERLRDETSLGVAGFDISTIPIDPDPLDVTTYTYLPETSNADNPPMNPVISILPT
jgi:hypothetical protein